MCNQFFLQKLVLLWKSTANVAKSVQSTRTIALERKRKCQLLLKIKTSVFFLGHFTVQFSILRKQCWQVSWFATSSRKQRNLQNYSAIFRKKPVSLLLRSWSLHDFDHERKKWQNLARWIRKPVLHQQGQGTNVYFFKRDMLSWTTPQSSMMSDKKNCSQDFLNAGQYQKNGILRYERVFGRTFVSTGGATTTKVKP